MIWSGSTTISSIATSGSAKAFSQLLWSGKSSEVWFSLRENHIKVGGFPVFPATQHWPGTIMCDFPQRKSHAVRGLHQHPQEIRVPRISCHAALAGNNYVRLSSRKVACSSGAPPTSTGNTGSPYFLPRSTGREHLCATFLKESRMQIGGSTNIHRKYGFGLHQLRKCSSKN